MVFILIQHHNLYRKSDGIYKKSDLRSILACWIQVEDMISVVFICTWKEQLKIEI